MIKLIILDRDGVINHDSDEYIKSEDEWQAIPGSLDAIARLNRAGYRVVIASNQSGLARGKLDVLTLFKIHRKMHNHLEQYGGKIEAVFYCPHGPDDDCSCRKPQPGLLHEISRRIRVPLYRTTFVGDSVTDIQAAQSVKANPALVLTGKGKLTRDSGKVDKSVPVYENLAAFADQILKSA